MTLYEFLDTMNSGKNMTALPGVTIGNNAIIATGAVITKDVPKTPLSVGVSAKVIKYINAEETGAL